MRTDGGSDGLEAAAVVFRAIVHDGDGMNELIFLYLIFFE